ncbi:MAG: M56 family metallopeptidase [Dehalococcoidales bacterium]
MNATHPNRTFSLLLGTGLIILLIMGSAAYRAVLAGCPAGSQMSFTCLFFPTHTDVGVHLLSYVFIGTIVLFAFLSLALWHRQRTKTTSLTRNLALLHAPDSELESLTRRLGLINKVQLVEFEIPFVFCMGFTSPRIYLSRGVADKLTPQELEVLLLHEKHHLENNDPLKILLGKMFASALFIFPFLKDILKRYLIEKEIAADYNVSHNQDHRQELAVVLEKLGGGTLDYRLEHLQGHAPRGIYPVSIPHLAVSFLAMAIALSTILIPLSGSHP